ncbi:hypothetical protein V1477_002178 [Vespula maculifrons]|uniref:Double jelly roll-like domain-containing protein n=1 Tax=Vespula maculifrons TaxID=7453 RepID=A0ABD2CYL1_VESMC
MEDLKWFMKLDSSSPTAEDGHDDEIKSTSSSIVEDRVHLDNNGIVCMFNEIRHKTKGIEVDNSKNIGITMTLKNFYYESLEYSLPLPLLQIKNFNNTNPN